MATVQMEINCLALFAADAPGAVHVLMPRTGDGHGHGHSIEPHVVRLYKAGLLDVGVGLEGWALDLGDTGNPSADITLKPATGVGEIVNLSDPAITGEEVDRSLIDDVQMQSDMLSSRVSFYGGRISNAKSELRWRIRGWDFRISNRVTWRIPNVADALAWTSIGAGGTPPVPSLSDLPDDGDDGAGGKLYSFRLFHTIAPSLPPNETATLDPAKFAHHFMSFYPLLGIDNPTFDLMPVPAEVPFGTVNCGTGGASVKPKH